jgi:hypothetical protein
MVFKCALVTALLLAAKVFATPLPAGATWNLNLWCDFEVVSEAEGPPKLGTKFTTRASGSVTDAEAGRVSREIGMWSGGQYTASMAADKKIVTVKSKKRTKGQCNDELPKMKSAVTNGLKTKDPLQRVCSTTFAPIEMTNCFPRNLCPLRLLLLVLRHRLLLVLRQLLLLVVLLHRHLKSLVNQNPAASPAPKWEVIRLTRGDRHSLTAK